jgi:hypothetical protein
MKLIVACVLLLGVLLSKSATPQDTRLDPQVAAKHPLLAGHEWVVVAGYPIQKEMVNRAEGDGQMGAGAYGVRFDNYVAGSIIVDVIIRPAVAIFLGWNPPAQYLNEAPEDLRVIFYQVDGTPHATRFAAGGACGLLFHTPDGVPINSITRFELCRRADAAWVKAP